MLTGKAKIDFEDWLTYELRKNAVFEMVDFYECPFLMQWGMYVDYFDKNDVKCEVRRKEYDIPIDEVYYESDANGYLGCWSTLEEAMKAAIKDADRHFNNKEL